jgi:DICT domain-containing protein
VIGAFQDERNYRAVEHRYRRLARVADAVGVFATFDALQITGEGEPAEIPVGATDALGHEWAVVIDAPGFCACLVGWEKPDPGPERTFEAVWTMDASVVRRAAQVGASLAAREAPEWSERLLELLADRPLAVESPAPGLTALTNRMLTYLDAR